MKCPHCGSSDSEFKGYVPTRQGRKKRRICLDCYKTFYQVDDSTASHVTAPDPVVSK